MSLAVRTLFALVAVSVVPGLARAEPVVGDYDPFGPGAPPWAFRVNASTMVADGETLGIDVSHASRWWGLELELGNAWLSDHSRALDTAALGRFGAMGRHHSVTLGLGPRLLVADSYGVVAAAQTELAYEYRHDGGFSVLVGAGPMVVLNDSGQGRCADTGFVSFCRGKFETGDANLRFRIAVGVSF